MRMKRPHFAMVQAQAACRQDTAPATEMVVQDYATRKKPSFDPGCEAALRHNSAGPMLA
jgi:hypothetical protein